MFSWLGRSSQEASMNVGWKGFFGVKSPMKKTWECFLVMLKKTWECFPVIFCRFNILTNLTCFADKKGGVWVLVLRPRNLGRTIKKFLSFNSCVFSRPSSPALGGFAKRHLRELRSRTRRNFFFRHFYTTKQHAPELRSRTGNRGESCVLLAWQELIRTLSV